MTTAAHSHKGPRSGAALYAERHGALMKLIADRDARIAAQSNQIARLREQLAASLARERALAKRCNRALQRVLPAVSTALPAGSPEGGREGPQT